VVDLVRLEYIHYSFVYFIVVKERIKASNLFFEGFESSTLYRFKQKEQAVRMLRLKTIIV
jgi:hypothetical protein